MVEEVIWTEQAAEDFQTVLDFLFTDWGIAVEENFYNRVFEVIGLIKSYNEIGEILNQRPATRKFLITKHNYILYQIVNNKLFILGFIDTRMS